MLAHSSRAIVGRMVVQTPRVGADPVRSRWSSPWLVAHAQRLLATSAWPWEPINGVVTRLEHRQSYATTGTDSTTSGTTKAKKSSTSTARAAKPKTKTTRKKTTTKKKTGTRATKKAGASETKAKAKPRAKAKTKSKKKPAAKRATTKRKKKTLTEDEKRKLRVRELRKLALKEPKGKPASAWTVYLQEAVQSMQSTTGASSPQAKVADAAKQASQGYKNLRPDELEVCLIGLDMIPLHVFIDAGWSEGQWSCVGHGSFITNASRPPS